MGIVYFNDKQYKEAIKSYTKATELDPDNPNYWNKLGNAYYENKLYNEAIEIFAKAIELRPDNTDYWINLEATYCIKNSYYYNKPFGHCYIRQRIEEASIAYIKNTPPPYLNDLRTINYVDVEYKRIIEYFIKAIDIKFVRINFNKPIRLLQDNVVLEDKLEEFPNNQIEDSVSTPVVFFSPCEENVCDELAQKVDVRVKNISETLPDEKDDSLIVLTDNNSNIKQDQTIHNTAVKLFLGDGTKNNPSHLEFTAWYDFDVCEYLLNIADNTADCIRITFDDTSDGNNTDAFIKQLQKLVELVNKLQKPAIFISKEPGAKNHFVCGMVYNKWLLLINPLGINDIKIEVLKDKNLLYETLAELKDKKIIEEIWLSSNILQKNEYEEENLVSCGPITSEIAMHLLTSLNLEELKNFFNGLSTREPTLHNISGLKYHGINILKLLPESLKTLSEVSIIDEEERYRQQLCAIRKNHCKLLETIPMARSKEIGLSVENYLDYCKKFPEKIIFNRFLFGEAEYSVESTDILSEYVLLQQEVNLEYHLEDIKINILESKAEIETSLISSDVDVIVNKSYSKNYKNIEYKLEREASKNLSAEEQKKIMIAVFDKVCIPDLFIFACKDISQSNYGGNRYTSSISTSLKLPKAVNKKVDEVLTAIEKNIYHELKPSYLQNKWIFTGFFRENP